MDQFTSKNENDKFTLTVYGIGSHSNLEISREKMVDLMSEETVSYLQSLGYKVKQGIPMLGLGASGMSSLELIIASLKDYLPVAKILIFFAKVVFAKYIRSQVNWSMATRTSLVVEVGYESGAQHWVGSWDPDNASRKLDTMIEAVNFGVQFLSDRYPNIDFNQVVRFRFIHGNAEHVYATIKNYNTPFNTARYKRLFRYTTFEKNMSKSFNVVNRLLIKRVDSRMSPNDKIYYKQKSGEYYSPLFCLSIS